LTVETGVGMEGEGVGVSPDPTDGGASMESSIIRETSPSLPATGEESCFVNEKIQISLTSTV
jgi:hypothetical protein